MPQVIDTLATNEIEKVLGHIQNVGYEIRNLKDARSNMEMELRRLLIKNDLGGCLKIDYIMLRRFLIKVD